MEVLREEICFHFQPPLSTGFNPCFNGSVERGHKRGTKPSADSVSILVLMEVLREAFGSTRNPAGRRAVSILVLMEVLREASSSMSVEPRCNPGFNPCFNGSVERGRSSVRRMRRAARCFNPCFNGSVERGRSLGTHGH